MITQLAKCFSFVLLADQSLDNVSENRFVYGPRLQNPADIFALQLLFFETQRGN